MVLKKEMNANTKILDQLSKRINNNNDSLTEFSKSKDKLTDNIIKNNKHDFTKIKQLHKEIDDIQELTSELRKAVFSLGSKLGDKLTKKEFEKFKIKIDSMNFEDTLHKQELERSFSKYANINSK
ncbi:MAG: hypothetical protein U9R00_02280 [Patescibacteria group bacterium]|nr:hypothetical protein [Patescibacteria group bacterium]